MISLDRRASRQHSGSMRFFHLSDLHLGKTLKGYDLLEDQAYVLDQVVAKLAELAPETLLIAGDIYDRAIPPVEAIRLFDAFLGKARAAVPGLRILVIPGNHDSAGRISFGASMLADSGLCIAARAEGKPAFVVESGGERAAVWALPFLTQASAPWEELASAGAEGEAGGSVGADGGEGAAGGAAPGRDASGATIRTQQELMRLATASIRKAMEPGTLNILVAHCFAAGGVVGDSELAYVGAAEQVDAALFEGFDYTALGHLHSIQSSSPRVWYSGAPLAYSVKDGEGERGFLSVELRVGEAPRMETIPLLPLHRVRRISGFFDDLVANPLPEAERGDYIEVRVLDEEPVMNAGERLKALYPRLLGVPQRAYELRFGEDGGLADDAPWRARDGLEAPDRLETAREDFFAFHREMTGEPPSEAMAALFDSMAGEASDAAD